MGSYLDRRPFQLPSQLPVSSKDPQSASGRAGSDSVGFLLGAAKNSLMNVTDFPHKWHEAFVRVASDESTIQ